MMIDIAFSCVHYFVRLFTGYLLMSYTAYQYPAPAPARFSITTHTHPFNGPFSGTTRVSRYQKGKTNLDFTEARDCECQWHQLGHMQVCISLQTDNHASTPPLKVFLQAGCSSCRPTNSVKALKAQDFQLQIRPNPSPARLD